MGVTHLQSLTELMLEEERAQERVGGGVGAHFGVRKMEFHSIYRSVLHFAIHLDVVFFAPNLVCPTFKKATNQTIFDVFFPFFFLSHRAVI